MRLQDYLAVVTNISLLDPAEERALWDCYKNQADMESRGRLIEHYQPLVVKALMRWRADEAILMDLVQEGIVGLIESVENFDPQRGVAFSLYAIHRIRGRMLNYLEKETRSVRVSLETPWDSAEGMALADTLADAALPVAEVAERNFLIDQLRTAVDRLPSKERHAVNAVFIEERDPAQVASALEITTSHLYRLQRQGIRRVRGMMSRLMGEMKK